MTETRQQTRLKASTTSSPAGSTISDRTAETASIQEELTSLYHDYAEQLSRTLRSMFGDGPPDPDDIAQEAFHRVIERGDLASIKNLKAFVWRTARNLLLNAKDREHTRSRYDYEIEQLFFAIRGYDSTPETVISAREQVKAVNRVLGEMPATRRRAFILHRVEGLSIADVGRRLGISRPGASKHISRAIAQIDAAFAEDREV